MARRAVICSEVSLVLIVMAIVVVIIPIPIRVPTTAVFIPPSVTAFPALFAGFRQFVSPMVGLLAEVAVMLDGFVKIMVGPCHVSSATVNVGAQLRCTGE